MKKQAKIKNPGMREFLRGPAGRALIVGFLVASLAAVGWSIWSNVRPDDSIVDANSPLFIDATNGKTFHLKLEPGMTYPVISPYSGQATGYKAELCYWNKDGTIKTDPTPVLLNSDIGKPGPTFCPDCGRLVVSHNPVPRPGMNPPPTEAQYNARHGIQP